MHFWAQSDPTRGSTQPVTGQGLPDPTQPNPQFPDPFTSLALVGCEPTIKIYPFIFYMPLFLYHLPSPFITVTFSYLGSLSCFHTSRISKEADYPILQRSRSQVSPQFETILCETQLTLELFQPVTMTTELDEKFHELSSAKTVRGVLILNSDGAAVKSSVDAKTTEAFAGMLQEITTTARRLFQVRATQYGMHFLYRNAIILFCA